MNVAALNVTVEPNARTERLDRDALNAMIKRLESSGTDPSFYVGVLSKMDSFEQTLSAKNTPSPTAPVPGSLKHNP
jgi:hypothetical protein